MAGLTEKIGESDQPPARRAPAPDAAFSLRNRPGQKAATSHRRPYRRAQVKLSGDRREPPRKTGFSGKAQTGL